LRLVPNPVFFQCPRGARFEGKSRLSWKARSALAFQLVTPFRERVTLRLQLAKVLVFLVAIAGIYFLTSYSAGFAAFGMGAILLFFTLHTSLSALTESIRADLGPKIELVLLETINPPKDEDGHEIFSRIASHIQLRDRSKVFE
jgi:hypothetical protein